MNIDDARQNIKYKICGYFTEDKKIISKLYSLGLITGTEIELVQKKPVFIIKAYRSKFALDKELAALIKICE